jgi:hypothetical protein
VLNDYADERIMIDAKGVIIGSTTPEADVESGISAYPPTPAPSASGPTERYDDWGRIMDDAWPTLRQHPPAYLRITIRSTAAERKARQSLLSPPIQTRRALTDRRKEGVSGLCYHCVDHHLCDWRPVWCDVWHRLAHHVVD